MAKQTKKTVEPVTLPNEVVGALADAFEKDTLTIKRWINKKDIRLTTDKAKEVFARKNIAWS